MREKRCTLEIKFRRELVCVKLLKERWKSSHKKIYLELLGRTMARLVEGAGQSLSRLKDSAVLDQISMKALLIS